MSLVLTVGVLVLLLVVGFLAYFGLRDVGRRRAAGDEQTWRNNVTVSAISLAALAAILFVVYAARNIIIGGDPNIGAFTLWCIRIGNYLALGAIVLSFLGKGRGRWSALVGGALMLLLWIAQGISL